MQRCDNCGLSVDNQHERCPLCAKPLGGRGESVLEYPPYARLYREEKAVTPRKLTVFVTIAAIIIVGTINILTASENPRPWSIVVAACLLYAFMTLHGTILSRSHFGRKVLEQFAALSILMVVFDLESGFSRWSLNYVLPVFSFTATLAITVAAIAKRSLWREYSGFLLAAFFASLLPGALYLIGLSSVAWTGALSAVYSLLSIVGLMVFSDRKLKDEVRKRFHT